MGKIYHDTDGDYVSLKQGERLYHITIHTDPPYIHPSFNMAVCTSSGYVIAPDKKTARANFRRRKSTKKELAETVPGARVAHTYVNDETWNICQHCGLLGGH